MAAHSHERNFGAQVTAPLAVPHGFRVLVAEDDAIQGLLLMTFLERLGVPALLVTDGQKAVAAVKEGEFGLVLMDHLMPRMNGTDATIAIREWERTIARAPVPIVAVTAGGLLQDCENYAAAGMNEWLLKPFSVRALADMVIRHAAIFSPQSS